MAQAYSEPAPAKVNLTLRVLRRRPDGYHDIESLVVFAEVGDALRFVEGPPLTLAVRGPTAVAAGELADNLVLKAARALEARIPGLQTGEFILTKRLPVAAGLGGGSADAAAAMRLLMRANGIAADDPRVLAAARATGADVPVCLDPRPRVMQGIGDILSGSLDLPRLPAVLVNPRVAVPTKDVFATLRLEGPAPARDTSAECDATAWSLSGPDRAAISTDLIARLANDRNDLEAPAIAIQPVIADVLAALRALPGCHLARMSGSGATCFALFGTLRAAASGARALRARHPAWWVRPTVLGRQR